MSIGSRLKELREKKGVTIKQVAADLGVSPSTYRDWELGTKISGEPYAAMATVLGTSLSYLLTGEHIQQSGILEDVLRMKILLEKIEININLAQ